MRRREFISGIGSAATWLTMASAQQSARARHIGVLMNALSDDPAGQQDNAAFREGLGELGWNEERNIIIDFRWPGDELERTRTMAKELVGLGPDALLARSTPATSALKDETDIIPIVFVNVTEPIESGFTRSLARPTENITGFTNFETSIGGKWVQLLKELDPRIATVGLIYNPRSAPFARLFFRSVNLVAPVLAIRTLDLAAQNATEIESALGKLATERGAAVVALPDTFNVEHRDTIIALVARYRLPTLYAISSSTPRGGLIAYAVDTRDTMRRAAGYIDRILKGAKPADLPVQQPVKFDLSVNLSTARALGLTVPDTLLVSADEVIQ
jgi:putative ABC transport system substrate-binding protein